MRIGEITCHQRQKFIQIHGLKFFCIFYFCFYWDYMEAYGDQRQHMCHMPVLFEPSIEIMSAGNIWCFIVNSKIQSSNLTLNFNFYLNKKILTVKITLIC